MTFGYAERERVLAAYPKVMKDELGADPGGLQGVVDALAVEGVDHAAGVADEEEAVGIQRGAVEAHRQGGAADRAGGLVVVELPLGVYVLDPPAHDVLVVGLLEGRGGVEGAEADVGPAVLEREEPAVAGHEDAVARVVAGPQLEVALEVVVALGRRVVRADGHAHDAVLALGAAHGGREAGGDAVAGDHDRSAVGDGLARGTARLVEALGR